MYAFILQSTFQYNVTSQTLIKPILEHSPRANTSQRTQVLNVYYNLTHLTTTIGNTQHIQFAIANRSHIINPAKADTTQCLLGCCLQSKSMIMHLYDHNYIYELCDVKVLCNLITHRFIDLVLSALCIILTRCLTLRYVYCIEVSLSLVQV